MRVDIFETSLTEKIKYSTKNENDNRYLNLTGDEMVGDLNMSGNKTMQHIIIKKAGCIWNLKPTCNYPF